ncbi:hypothetical protein [Thiolapillus sp.]|uniref:hypothetical protein n=1 Tax=Thiolapillus sp. TaxID=2017437 RepID=UPI003AF8A30B
MTRTAGAPIGCQRPSRFWGLGCPKIYHEAEDTLDGAGHIGRERPLVWGHCLISASTWVTTFSKMMSIRVRRSTP